MSKISALGAFQLEGQRRSSEAEDIQTRLPSTGGGSGSDPFGGLGSGGSKQRSNSTDNDPDLEIGDDDAFE